MKAIALLTGFALAHVLVTGFVGYLVSDDADSSGVAAAQAVPEEPAAPPTAPAQAPARDILAAAW